MTSCLLHPLRGCGRARAHGDVRQAGLGPHRRAAAGAGDGTGGVELFAVEECKRVPVLLTDMTAYVDAMKEVDIAIDTVSSNCGCMGYLYINRFFRLTRYG